MSAGLRAAALCLFFSGAASLVLEVVWTRLLRLVFGSTTLAVSTILVAYMLGLGLGGLFAGRIAGRLRNPLRAYGQVEIAIAAYAVLVPWLLGVLPRFQQAVLANVDFWSATALRFVVVLVVLLVPTMLMGATLPILVAGLIRGDTPIARRLGLLYGINTLGAVVGVFAAAFCLFPWLGVGWTNWAAAAVDALIGVFVIKRLAGVHERSVVVAVDAAAGQPHRPSFTTSQSAALATYLIVGFTSLTYEVSWTRGLSMVLGSSIYAFTTMLGAFLSGIALGSLAARRWLERLRRPLFAYSLGLAGLGLLSFATMLLFRSLPDLFPRIFVSFGLSHAAVVMTSVSVAILAMLGPTLVLGALFPLLVHALGGAGADSARTTGTVYFLNTIGSAAGALGAGFFLIPLLGLRDTLLLAIVLNLFSALAMILVQRELSPQWRWPLAVSLAITVAGVLLSPPQWNQAALARGVFRNPGEEIDVGVAPLPLRGVTESQILFYREGINTTVSVHRQRGELNLRVDGKTDASSGRDMSTQVLLGEVPMLFGARPERVAVIGLASAVTVGSVVLHRPQVIDVVELEPAMIEASHYFDDINHQPLGQPGVRVIADDGRSYLGGVRQAYDVIISEPSNPWITGAASLFTREFFRTARAALAPGGRLLQWVQLYDMQPAVLQSILAALTEQFPYVYGFADEFGGPDLVLLAGERPLGTADLPRWEKLPQVVRDDLTRVRIGCDADLWSLLRLLPDVVNAVARRAPVVNSDSNLFVELQAPWGLYDQSSAAENWKQFAGAQQGAAALLNLDLSQPAARELVGELALAHLRRQDNEMSAELVALTKSAGGSAHARAATAMMQLAESLEDEDEEASRERALGELRGAAAEQHDSFDIAYLVAQLEFDRGKLEAAEASIERALRIRPDEGRARYLHLQILVAQQRGADAWREAQWLLSSPFAVGEPDVLAQAAQAAALAEHTDDAIRLLRMYLEKMPEFPVQWTLLSNLATAAGDTQLAAEAGQNAELSERNLVLKLHQQARRNLRMGQREQAIFQLKSCLIFDPHYEPARDELRTLGVL